MEYLLIDGYNVINAWGDVFDLKNESFEDCRDKLLTIISNYQGYKKINIIVVFDAYRIKGSREKQERFDGLTIVYTGENITADNYIERFVYKMGNTHTVRVVTSDYLEQTIILSSGGIRMAPWELKEEVMLAPRKTNRGIIKKIDRVNTIEARIKPELLEKLEKIRRGKL